MEKYPHLFSKFKLGDTTLANRIVMSPMTRSRADWNGDVPSELAPLYYAQRSSAGLIVTEASQVSLQGKGYAGTPGIYTKAQVEAWKKVTKAVHDKKGHIFLQLWHVGRISHEDVTGLQPLAPSAIRAENTITFVEKDAKTHTFSTVQVSTPRAMTVAEIKQTIADFAKGAKNAIEAGFDGVEIHGGHGYLIDQFLRSKTNHRTDEYGGTGANRIRIAVEVAKAVAEAVGPSKVGIRLSPFVKAKDMEDPFILDEILDLAVELNKLDIAYIHISDADFGEDAPKVNDEYRSRMRARFGNAIIVAGYKTAEEGERLVAAGLADLVAFGRPFLANPDLPERIRQGIAFSPDKGRETYFGGGEFGYTDYAPAKTK